MGWGVWVQLLGQEKRKEKKGREEKAVDFSSTSLFPARKREAVVKVETVGQQTTRRGGHPGEPATPKAGRTCETAAAFQIH